MTESLPNLVWGGRADGTCDSLGKRWVEYTGVPEAEQLGYGWLEQVHSDERERVREAWRAATRSGDAIGLEFRIRAQDGTYRWFKVAAAPVRDAKKGMILRWYCSATDVDDLKRGALEHGRAS
jgi:PAS domain S-box-containing protein